MEIEAQVMESDSNQMETRRAVMQYNGESFCHVGDIYSLTK